MTQYPLRWGIKYDEETVGTTFAFQNDLRKVSNQPNAKRKIPDKNDWSKISIGNQQRFLSEKKTNTKRNTIYH